MMHRQFQNQPGWQLSKIEDTCVHRSPVMSQLNLKTLNSSTSSRCFLSAGFYVITRYPGQQPHVSTFLDRDMERRSLDRSLLTLTRYTMRSLFHLKNLIT